MKRILTFTILILLLFTELNAQRRRGLIGRRNSSVGSIVLSVGPAYCAGDQFGFPNKINTPIKTLLNGTNADVSLGFRQKFANNLSYRVSLLYGNYSGDDGDLFHSGEKYSFRSNVFQFTTRAEYSVSFGRKYGRSLPNSVYWFTGAGVISSKITFPNETTVGVAEPKPAVIIPFGLGYQFDFDNNFLLGAELGSQFALSKPGDYIDGYHPEGFSDFNDYIVSFSITLAYRIF